VIWERLTTAWRAAIEEAWDAYRAGTNPIGAVICDRSGTIVARARNRILDRTICEGQLHGTRLAHAEMNALLRLPPQLEPKDLVLHATVEPCPLCLGAIVMANVRAIRYASRDPWAGSIALLDQNAYIASKTIRREGPTDPALERALKALGVESMLRRGEGARGAAVLAAFRAALPDAVAAGERLYSSGELHALAEAGAPAAEALDLLDRSARLVRKAFEGPSTPMPPQETAVMRE
jgi:tRNA(adenine34) deaminase